MNTRKALNNLLKKATPRGVYSLTEFLRHTKRHRNRLKKSGRPTLLLQRGKPAVVVWNASSWQAVTDERERLTLALATAKLLQRRRQC